MLHLTESQKWLAISLPVLLGSVGRIPLGILADRMGGRLMFALTLVASIIPVVLLGLVTSYPTLLVCGFLVGVALASSPGTPPGGARRRGRVIISVPWPGRAPGVCLSITS